MAVERVLTNLKAGGVDFDARQEWLDSLKDPSNVFGGSPVTSFLSRPLPFDWLDLSNPMFVDCAFGSEHRATFKVNTYDDVSAYSSTKRIFDIFRQQLCLEKVRLDGAGIAPDISSFSLPQLMLHNARVAGLYMGDLQRELMSHSPSEWTSRMRQFQSLLRVQVSMLLRL